jgi:signal transduction histidine kinase
MDTKYNILIVDDDVHNIQLAINILKEDEKYNIIFTTSGKEALQRVKEYTFDLILLDILMEPMDGFEVCKILKSDSLTKDIPIIFLSAKDDESSISQGFELGAVDYITKPFFSKELKARVKTHIQLHRYKDSLQQKLKLQDKLMLEQNKMAAMGEMITNIAHQWKQPLSIITTVSSGIKVSKELDVSVDKDTELASLDNILLNANHLSQTIDDFRDFFEQKEKILFHMEDIINKTINLINSTLKHNNIKINKNIEDIEFVGLDNELIQVLINIINNAQDALNMAEIKNKEININVYRNKNNAIVEVWDNAGGIPDDVIDHIFEAHFTTKRAINGTGIGLHMAQKIVQEHFHGKIYVTNIELDGKRLGAKFRLELPIKPQ